VSIRLKRGRSQSINNRVLEGPVSQAVKLRTVTCGNKGEQENLEEEQDDHRREERLPKLVFCVDCVHYFLVFIVYSSS